MQPSWVQAKLYKIVKTKQHFFAIWLNNGEFTEINKIRLSKHWRYQVDTVLHTVVTPSSRLGAAANNTTSPLSIQYKVHESI